MKKLRFLFYALAVILSTSFTACGSDDDDDEVIAQNSIPAEIQRAFSEKYPGVKADSWRKKDSYYIADFTISRASVRKASAWFASSSVWMMTEYDEDNIDNLPAAVVAAFRAGIYASWEVDDIDIVERAGMETVFVIEVEKGSEEYDLYYAADGTLIKVVSDDDDDDDDDDDYLPEIPVQITDYLNASFKGYQIIDAEFDDGIYEIEIISDGRKYEIKFSSAFRWIETEYDIMPDELPQAIKDYISSRYPGFEIEAEVLMNDKGTFYKVELELGDEEYEFVFNAEGEIVK